MLSVKNVFGQGMSKSITSLIGLMFIDSYIKNGKKGKPTYVPDDFKPILRFAVCSDVHLDGEETQEAAVRFGELFDDMYKYSECCSEYKKLDAVLVAGDFTGDGDEKHYRIFNEIIKTHKKEETLLLTVLGNHEFIKYRDVDASVGYSIYKKYINEEVNTHTVINGFHFIGISYDEDGKKFTGKLSWLREQLEKAKKDSGEKPIFVFQHPHPFATVYGSINWGDYEIKKVLKDYPQVVDFSGHSHYAPSDPRSVWQGAFTAVGCGSLSAFMGNLNYIDGDRDAPGKSGGFRLIEADCNGNIIMKLYDSANRTFFDSSEYYFSNLSDSSKRAYTWSKQKSLDTSPVFQDNEEIYSEADEEGNIYLCFPEAKGYYCAENYKITVSSGAFHNVWCGTAISDYVRAVGNQVRVNIGKLSKGSYKVKITAYSPYAKRGGSLKGKIII